MVTYNIKVRVETKYMCFYNVEHIKRQSKWSANACFSVRLILIEQEVWC